MTDNRLTQAEEKYIKDLKEFPATISSRLLGWVFEIVPSVGFFSYGLYSDSRLFVILGFVSLLFFAVWRMYSQLRGFRMLKHIFLTRESKSEAGDA